MSSWLERVRAALAPEGYDVVRELASGGMGTVFLARQRVLDRLVAIKIIRPELHTALAVERFRQEAKTLAGFSHKNIVSIHDHGEADGMPYYVMEHLQGETVADRLRRGPLAPAEVLNLGRDLLTALEAAHARGVVHRDVKPSNLFLLPDRAVLTDFGVAKRIPTDAATMSNREPLTFPGQVPGTALYMAPEQLRSLEATPRSDLYAAALVIYEAYTGRHWFEGRRRRWRAWRHVPRPVRRVLRQALAERPEDRWPDAASFRGPFWHSRERRYRKRAVWMATGGLVTGAVVVGFWGQIIVDWIARRGPARIQVERLTFTGPAAERWVADSIACSLAADLSKYPDLAARGPCDARWGRLQWKTVFAGHADAGGDTIHVAVGPLGGTWRVDAWIPVGAWREDVADLGAALYDSLLGSSRLLEPSLPRAVLPKVPPAKKRFLDGEHLFAQARWGEAFAAYGEAAAADTTCWICYWRHNEVGRWLSLAEDTADVARYTRSIRLFPLPYQRLITAEAQPLGRRVREFEAVARRWPDFFFGQFRFADEMFHRGPLVGHERRESVSPFNAVLTERRGDFGPAWEHLAWAWIADGDSAEAEQALARLRATGPSRDAITAQIRALLEVAFACRFLGSARCHRVVAAQLQRAEAAGGTTIDAGARWLPYFDAQVGAIELGRVLEPRPQLARSALLAQAFGALALGQVDSARAALRRVRDRYGESAMALFADELEAALLMFDPDSGARARWPVVRASLAERAALPTTSPDERRRSAFVLELATRGLGERGDTARMRRALADEPAPRALEQLFSAVEAGSRGDVREALRVSEPLIEMEAGASDPDPFFRTALHLLRAEWRQRAGSREGARRELIWYQNSDVYRYPVGDPELAEVDWAFGSLARWRLARLLDAEGDRGDAACHACADVQRLWSQGDVRYGARADTAARRLAELNCKVGS